MIKGMTILVFLLFILGAARSATIYVPDDYAAIQDAINAAANGDIILVRKGTYCENLDLIGKAVHLKSELGPVVTIIDGMRLDSVITLNSGEGRDTIIEGFTITNGDDVFGGGIHCEDTSPTITGNRIDENRAVLGGGISCLEKASPDIRCNRIYHNTVDNGGGGIYCRFSSPSITGNVISWNLASYHFGGGILCEYGTDATIFNNLIIQNKARTGAGICYYSGSPSISSNTIANNKASSTCGGIYLRDTQLTSENLILWDNLGGYYHEIWLENSQLTIRYSNVQGGEDRIGLSALSKLDWETSNIVSDPLFHNPVIDDYHLQQSPVQPGVSNPCVDSGNPASAMIPGSTRTDRVQDSGVLDMGCHYKLIPQGKTIEVPADYSLIQDAVEASSDGDTILVSPGTYWENVDFIGRAVTLRSTAGPHATIIDGCCNGSVVTFKSGEDSFSVIEGFTLTNGSGLSGGGVFCSESSPTVTGNFIVGNQLVPGSSSGGGVYCWGKGGARIIDNRIENNFAQSGGGIRCQSSYTVIAGNVIRDNRADGSGGGIGCSFDNSTIRDNIISANTSSRSGGGIILTNGYSHAISGNIIEKNAATQTEGYGGGIYCNNTENVRFDANVILRNEAQEGGGVRSYRTSPLMTNNVIAGNQAVNIGGGICLSVTEDGTAFLAGNTIVLNTAGEGGGIHFRLDSDVEISNTILWDNAAGAGAEMYIGSVTLPSVVSMSHSDVRGGQSLIHVSDGCMLFWGDGMIASDPLFVDPGRLDFHLPADSPCLDMGTDLPPVPSDGDFEGDPRIQGDHADIGADEFYPHLYRTGTVVPGGNVVITVIGSPGRPAAVALGSGVLDAPRATPFGPLYLDLPLLSRRKSTGIPTNGVWSIPATIPPGCPPGEEYPLQAIVELEGRQPALLTNLLLLRVE